MPLCSVCPRKCGVERPESKPETPKNICRMGTRPVVGRAAPHFDEEPCISGTRGSGAVFFAGCPLRCVYCQNFLLSRGLLGKEISVSRLKEIYKELIGQNVHNINLINPTHFSEAVLKSLEDPLPVPVIFNTGGYDDVETLKRFEGRVAIYMPDLKYMDDRLGMAYSGVSDYGKTASAAIFEMFRQRGKYEMSPDGLLTSGVLIRHLVLPGHLKNTFRAIDFVADNFPKGSVLFSLMSQYTPLGDAGKFPGINRRLTGKEQRYAQEYLLKKGVEDGYLQERSSAGDNFVPPFDLTGV